MAMWGVGSQIGDGERGVRQCGGGGGGNSGGVEEIVRK